MDFHPEQYRLHKSAAGLACHSSTSTSTIAQGSKAIPGKSSQENKILTDCSIRGLHPITRLCVLEGGERMNPTIGALRPLDWIRCMPKRTRQRRFYHCYPPSCARSQSHSHYRPQP